LFDFINRKKYFATSDADLILLYRKEKAKFCIDIIYNRYGHLLLAIAFKYIRNREEAEDVVMNLFENLGNKIQQHDIQNFKSWLHTTIKNECLMHLRKTKKINSAYSLDEIELYTIDDEQHDFHVLKEHILTLLESTLNELKSEQKKCVELFYLENKSYLEIAELLNLSLNTVKSAIQNGKRMLKVKLEIKGVKYDDL
jgi:RNA polymerase sigma factor (sigma-70 family)